MPPLKDAQDPHYWEHSVTAMERPNTGSKKTQFELGIYKFGDGSDAGFFAPNRISRPTNVAAKPFQTNIYSHVKQGKRTARDGPGVLPKDAFRAEWRPILNYRLANIATQDSFSNKTPAETFEGRESARHKGASADGSSIRKGSTTQKHSAVKTAGDFDRAHWLRRSLAARKSLARRMSLASKMLVEQPRNDPAPWMGRVTQRDWTIRTESATVESSAHQNAVSHLAAAAQNQEHGCEAASPKSENWSPLTSAAVCKRVVQIWAHLKLAWVWIRHLWTAACLGVACLVVVISLTVRCIRAAWLLYEDGIHNTRFATGLATRVRVVDTWIGKQLTALKSLWRGATELMIKAGWSSSPSGDAAVELRENAIRRSINYAKASWIIAFWICFWPLWPIWFLFCASVESPFDY